MAKGSRIDRVVEYFRTAGIEEAKYVYQRAGEIVSERQIPMTIQGKLALGKRKKRARKAVQVVAGGTIEGAETRYDGPALTGGIQEKAASAGE